MPDDAAANDEATRVAQLELASVMQSGRGFVYVYSGLLLSTAWLMLPVVPLPYLLLWMASYALYIAARTKATTDFHADEHRFDTGPLFARRRFVALSAFAHGLTLGSTALLALPLLEPGAKIGLTAIVIIICAAAVSYVAAMPTALNVFLSVSLIPYSIVWLVMDQQELKEPLTLLPLTAWVFHIYLGRRHYATLRAGFKVIFENERLSDQLRHLNVQLEAIGSSRSQLFAIASHDLRQPVHALGLTIEQLDPTDSQVRLRSQFGGLKESLFLVSEMLSELMDLSNLERGAYVLKMGAIDLGALLEQVRIGQLPEARRRGLRLEIASAENLWVRSDSNLLRRILFNLVSNAIRYTPGGSIDVSAHVSDTGEVSIRVHDTGIGIPRERLGDIFLDYVRVDETSQEGVGLGLAIVQRAVHLLGHKLTVDSVVGEGSQFELWLGTPIEREPARAPIDRAAAPTSSLEPAALFVIEDDPRSLDAMCGLAKKWGWIPYGGQSAKAVIAQIAATPTNWPLNSAAAGALPGVIVSDKQLGAGASGFDAIAAIRKHFGTDDLPALMVTGDVSHAVHAQPKEHGIAVLHKPCSPTLLWREIESLLSNYRAKRHGVVASTASRELVGGEGFEPPTPTV